MIKLTQDDFFTITDKKKYSISTSLGLSLKVVYKFWVSEFKKVRMGIIITTFKNIAKVRCVPIDKFDNAILNEDVILLPKELDKFMNTKNWCVRDFMKDHPEYRKFTIV